MMSRDEHDEGGRRGRGGREGRGGRRGGWQVADLPPADDAADWFRGRLPDDWFSEIDVRTDREEVTVIGTLTESQGAGADGAEAEGRISRFRADTKAERIEIALEAQARYQRKVSWGVRLGDTEALFAHVAAPVMTRLRQPERQVLDTLVDAGVARSRSDALAWSVRLVGEHAEEWLGQLRDAMAEVDKLRGEGPSL
jgi:Arc/MetJ-type ribon-helix-helix transcriptional regulator